MLPDPENRLVADTEGENMTRNDESGLRVVHPRVAGLNDYQFDVSRP